MCSRLYCTPWTFGDAWMRWIMERRESEVSVDLSFCFQVSYSSYVLYCHCIYFITPGILKTDNLTFWHSISWGTHTQALEIRFSIKGLFIPRGPLQLLQIDRHHHHRSQSQFHRPQHRHYHHPWWQLTMPNTGWCPSLISFKGAGSFHIHRKTMKELWALAAPGIRERPPFIQVSTHDLIVTWFWPQNPPFLTPCAHGRRMAGVIKALSHVFLYIYMWFEALKSFNVIPVDSRVPEWPCHFGLILT